MFYGTDSTMQNIPPSRLNVKNIPHKMSVPQHIVMDLNYVISSSGVFTINNAIIKSHNNTEILHAYLKL